MDSELILLILLKHSGFFHHYLYECRKFQEKREIWSSYTEANCDYKKKNASIK